MYFAVPAFHRISSTHWARELPGPNASPKYWVSRATFPSLNSDAHCVRRLPTVSKDKFKHSVLSIDLVFQLEVIRVGCSPVEIQCRSNLAVFHSIALRLAEVADA